MAQEAGETGQAGLTGHEPGQTSNETPKELLQCPFCSRTFKDQRGLGPHLRFHKPKVTKVAKGAKVNVGGGNGPASDVIGQAVNKALEDQLTKLIPELKKGIEDNLSTTLFEAIKLLNEKVNTEVSNLAQKAEAELLARFPAAGAGNLPMAQGTDNPILQALFARILGGGGGADGGGSNFMEQASRIGQAIGAMMQPIASIQSQAFSNALKLMDIASKFPTATPAEKAKVYEELAEATGAPTLAPPAPPPPADKAPGALGLGS